MPRVKEVLVEPYRTEKLAGGWRVIRVTAVGMTYRAKLLSPDEVGYPCPTHFRKWASAYKWARKQLRLMQQKKNDDKTSDDQIKVS